jgi:hypothetical protein
VGGDGGQHAGLIPDAAQPKRPHPQRHRLWHASSCHADVHVATRNMRGFVCLLHIGTQSQDHSAMQATPRDSNRHSAQIRHSNRFQYLEAVTKGPRVTASSDDVWQTRAYVTDMYSLSAMYQSRRAACPHPPYISPVASAVCGEALQFLAPHAQLEQSELSLSARTPTHTPHPHTNAHMVPMREVRQNPPLERSESYNIAWSPPSRPCPRASQDSHASRPQNSGRRDTVTF